MNLEELDLSDNPIATIDSVCFVKNVKLRVLTINNCLVKSLVSLRFLKNLNQVESLSLSCSLQGGAGQLLQLGC